MAVQWPLIVARLVALLPTLSGWDDVTVYDGAPVTADVPLNYCTVAYVSDESAGTYLGPDQQQEARFLETGSVVSQLTVRIGESDPSSRAAARTLVFSLMNALDDYIRANRRMGVLSPEGYATLQVDVHSLSTKGGTAQTLVFAVNYYTVT